jgi:hypothetical protein
MTRDGSEPSAAQSRQEIHMTTLVQRFMRVGALGIAACAGDPASAQTIQTVTAPKNARDFGAGTSISDGILYVTAAQTNDGRGAVYAYDLTSDLSSPIAMFSENLGPDTQFGRSIAASGNWLAVTAAFAPTSSNEPGRLFLYRRDAQSWTLSDSIEVPADGCDGCWSEGPNFVEFAGDQIVWGHGAFDSPSADQGAVHVFDIEDGLLTHRQSLQHSSGSAWDYFGNGAVTCDGDWLMVCARLEDVTGPQYGAVAVYRRDSSGSWTETQMIAINPSLGSFPNFGAMIAISGDHAVITAGNTNGDHAYVFKLNSTRDTWEFQTELDLSGTGATHSPRVVMPSSDRIIVAARGRLLVFDMFDGFWTRTLSVENETAVADGGVERSQLSADGFFVAAGAEYEPSEDSTDYQEFVLVADLRQHPPCTADLSGNGVVDGGDLGIWLSLAGYDCQSDPDCPADVNGDGVSNGADLGAILAAWGECPN